MEKFKRSRLWVNTGFQLRLLVRVSLYLIAFVVAAIHVAFVLEYMWHFATGALPVAMNEYYSEFMRRQSGFVFTLILLAPIFLYDLLKFSHRLAGPLFRCQKVMEDMAEGKQVSEFYPRKYDLMHDLFQSFNRLILAWNEQQEKGQLDLQQTPVAPQVERGSPAGTRG